MGRRHRAVFPVRQPASNHWRRRSTHRLRGRNNRRSTRSTQPLHPHSYSVFVWEFMLDLLCCWTSFRKTCHEINREKVKQQIPRLLAITSPLPRCLQKHARFGRLRSAFSFWFPKGMSVLGDLFGRNHSGGAHSLFHPPQRHRPIRASHLARLHGIYASSCRHFRRVRHVDGV
ncbi:hypothetical protein DFJ73DRAFT_4626 [Zopfochytrium polystomum]|nr:hypothetical protein DFJ73DRAFT_4626 [Zopfochytrium polystomum]